MLQYPLYPELQVIDNNLTSVLRTELRSSRAVCTPSFKILVTFIGIHFAYVFKCHL